MTDQALAAVSAFWLGILTSISPCPLATNIAATSFVLKSMKSERRVILTSLVYALGRMLAYTVLGVLIVASVLSISRVSNLLQEYMNKILGPLLILVGMVLLGFLNIGLPGAGASQRVQRRAESWGIWGAGLLGIVFALSFCPISAALFFGSLVPLALKYHSSILLPALYGLGTALPVVVFATVVGFGTQRLGVAFNKVTQIDRWVRPITAWVLVAIGVYFSLAHIFKVLG
ncbi:MAG: aromatic aminobenezylarsenical efflux permease ArsG family transporter [Candidatus Eisenbacteria bacterium]